MSDQSISSVPLVEVIDALRADLKAAQQKSDPEHPLIVEDIEVELQVVVTKGGDGHGKGKLGIGVFSAELNVNGKWQKAATQMIKLKLSAKSLNPETGELENTQIGDVDEY